MDIPFDQLLKLGTPWAFVANLNTGGFASSTTVVTPTASKIVTYNIGGQRSATTYGLVLTGIHVFASADATPRTCLITEYNGSTDYEILTVGNQATYSTTASYSVWHPLKIGIQSGASVTNGNVIRIKTSAAWANTARLRLEGFHTSDPSLWNAYVSAHAIDTPLTF